MGGHLMVVCEAANGHEVVELAHNNSCEDSGATYSNRESSGAHESFQIATEYCVDTPLTRPPVLRQDDRPIFQSFPIVLTYSSMFDAVAVPRRIPQAPVHLSSPDSPEAMARSIILLI